MNVILGNAHWFGFLALAALPILLHLVARARPPVYEFASLKFIREVTRKTMRLKQPRDWLVLLLRTLALLALVAAFLQPRLLRRTPLAAAAADKTVVLLIDRSASMAYADAGASYMAKAADQAKAILEAAGGPTLANVVWIDRTPEAVFPEPGPNRSYLIDQIQRQQAVPEPGAVEAAWRLAVSQFEKRQDAAAELFVLSDFQASGWRDAALETPPRVTLQMIKVGGTAAENLALLDVKASPAQPLVDQSFEVRCRVANYSDTPRRGAVFLQVGQQRQSKTIDLAPWGETETAMLFRGPDTPALLPIEARVDEDAFPGDDQRYGIVAVREALKLALVSSPAGAPGTYTVRQLGQAFSWVSVSAFEGIDDALAARPDVMLLIDWEGGQAGTLRDRAETGLTVWCQAGAAVRPAACASLFEQSGGSGNAVPESRNPGWSVTLTDAEDPLFALFAQGEYGDPFAGMVRQRVRLPALPLAGSARLLARFDDGAAALISERFAGGGRLYLSALPLDQASASWSEQSAFVALWGELLRQSLEGREETHRETLTGLPWSWTPPAEIDPVSVRLLDSRNNALPTSAETTQSGLTLTSEAMALPGHYRWTLSGAVVDRALANFPREESDLRTLERDALSGKATGAGARGAAAALRRGGQPLWPWCLALAAMALLLEAIVLGWGGTTGSQSERPLVARLFSVP